MRNTSSEQFFEVKYRHQTDPWQFASSAYELDRYTTTLALLDSRRFDRAFEPGCSIGILTEQLASRCGHVEALEISATAVQRARTRCRHLGNVVIRHGALPLNTPAGGFDLIVFSEIGYYFAEPQLRAVAKDLASRLTPGGMLLATHWLGESPDHRLSGDGVHSILEATIPYPRTASQRHEGFRIDRWERP